MKKIVVIILAFLHLSASAGVSMHMHYCMGKMADWDLSQKVSRVCGNCGMEKFGNKDCCKDEYKFVKNNDDQKAAEATFQLIQLASVALPVSFFETLRVDLPSVTEAYAISHSPPGSHPAVYIRNCVFRI